MTIFDLKKGQKVWGGIMPQGQGFAVGSAMCQELEITRLKFGVDYCSCCYSTGLHKIRMTYGADMIINRENLFEQAIYPTIDDFINGENKICIPDNDDIYEGIMERLGVKIERSRPQIWVWNEETKQAEVAERFEYVFELSDLKLPEGYYPTKAECEKANKKAVELEVTTKHRVFVDEEDVENALNDPTTLDRYDLEFVSENVARKD